MDVPLGLRRLLRLVSLQGLSLGITLACSTTRAADPAAHTLTCRIEPPIGSQTLLPHATAHASAAPSPKGIRKLLYLRVRFTDDREDPVSLEAATEDLTRADALFRRMSYGAFGLDFTVSPVLQLGTARTDYLGSDGFDRFIEDARQAGSNAGWDYREFELDVVRHSGVATFAGGNARLGARGAQVQIGGPVILVHELGHNLGLLHANTWDTSGPGVSLGSPPLPSNYPSLPDPRSIPMHPDSVIGHDTVTGPGQAVEYGDLWDIMGGGDRDFQATYKSYLGWLPGGAVVEPARGLTTNRLHRLDVNSLTPTATYALRLSTPHLSASGRQTLSIELPVARGDAPHDDGVLVRWIDAAVPPAPSLVLDGTPGSAGGSSDSMVPLGRTLSHPAAGWHVTPIAAGTDPKNRWVDVVVCHGDTSTNQPPTVVLLNAPSAAAPGEPARFEAAAADPDGDALSWHWSFSDEHATALSYEATHAWTLEGDYVVRVEVTDRRGGAASAQTVVRVGQPKGYRISGRVRDADGQPVAGVRVHNGASGERRPSAQLVQGWTDSDGSYVLGGLDPGTWPISAFHPDAVVRRRTPVILSDADLEGVDLVLDWLPVVRVEAPAEIVEESGFLELFTFTRTGSVDQSLSVQFHLGGTAVGGVDYIRPFTPQVHFPAGARTATLPIQILDDREGDPDETLVVTVAPPARQSRQAEDGSWFDVYHPGLEIVRDGSALSWSQTRPVYVTAHGTVATVRILDNDPITPTVVSIRASETAGLEEPLVDTSFEITRSGDTSAALAVRLLATGSAVPGVDYESLPSQLILEPGEQIHVLNVRPIADAVSEPPEELVLEIVPDPSYGIGVGWASVRILDRVEFPQSLRISGAPDGWWNVEMSGAPAQRLVLEGSTDLKTWEAIRTNRLFNATSATLRLPPSSGPRFFRTVGD